MSGERARDVVSAPCWALLDSPILNADCIAAMRTLPAASVDAIVTDPPYGIEFMGKAWDAPWRTGHAPSAAPAAAFQSWCEQWALEALRVLRPGGHLLAFGGPRTWHRLAAGIEDAGFEIRDSLMWMFGSGFPKSLDVSKAIDRAAGAERRVLATRLEHDITRPPGGGAERLMTSAGAREQRLVETSAPATPAAQRWAGWGTALKPGYEPIVLARKPLSGTVAANLLAHGTGALNIDGCRIGTASPGPGTTSPSSVGGARGSMAGQMERVTYDGSAGRWPANMLLSHTEHCRLVGVATVRANGHFPSRRGPSGYGSASDSGAGGLKGQDGLDDYRFDGESVERWDCAPDCPVALLDEQTGELLSGANPTRRRSDKFRTAYGEFAGEEECTPARGADRGGGSRFFYCSKTSRHERDAGTADGNPHPTVKPIDLMRWLLRLVTPPDGVALDLFAGSGSTICAGELEQLHVLGIERDPEYAELARRRAAWWASAPAGADVEKVLRAHRTHAQPDEQLTLE